MKPASSLAATQAWFFGQLQPGARRSAGPVRSAGELPARARVAVYADMYLARLIEALGAEFPRLAAALGPVRFEKLATTYFRAHPSTNPNIQHVGRELPKVLARRPPRGAPFAADLAKLDQTVSAVYVADGLGDAPVLAAEARRQIAPEAWPTLRFKTTSTLRLLRLGWRFPKEGPPQKRPTGLRVWRKGLDVFEAEMQPDEQRALRAMLAGKSFGQVCVAAGTAQRAATLLATWVEDCLLESLDDSTGRRSPREARSV